MASFAATDVRLLTPAEKKAKEKLRLVKKARGVKKRVQRELAKGNAAKAADLTEQVERLREQIRELREEE